MISFEPPLPEWKTEAISRVRMTSYVKVFVAWSQKWWTDREFVNSSEQGTTWVVLMDEGDENDKWRVMAPMRSSVPILMFSAVGKEGLRVESLTEQEIKEEVQLKLARAYTQKVVPLPDSIIKSNWSQNEFYRGAFSFFPTAPEGITHDDYHDLSYPVIEEDMGGIFFAGEAMSDAYRGYLHAAYTSGEEAAINVRKLYFSLAVALGAVKLSLVVGLVIIMT